MHRLTRCLWIWLALAGGVPREAIAQTLLTWQQVKNLFEVANPTLLAGQIGVDQTKAQQVTAFLRPNPELTTTLDQIDPFTPNPYRPLGMTLPLISASYLLKVT